MTERELAALFDHTYLKANGTQKDFDRIIQEAIEIQPATVAVNQTPLIYFVNKLTPYGIKVDTGAGFPLGANTIETKVFEALNAIENGAGEIDYMVNVSRVLDHDWNFIDEEMQRMVEAVHGKGILLKVIFENCYLDHYEIVKLCRLAVKNKVEFIKTSTGMVTGGGATVGDVRLMKDTVGNDCKVKASGGIRTWETCKAMLDAGAERIGTSSSLRILEEFREAYKG
ncbi:deoxyribose-phosphate aldolase [[Clostridium] innocuum]|jgi:deoxyribose-phosphate aldolase|nr:deoxyribose-phosphate aldolase [[Clostridium] innocuum]MCR0575392.1 deoxyribose-phosphate aldolase [[Clostridium] innocuum]